MMHWHHRPRSVCTIRHRMHRHPLRLTSEIPDHLTKSLHFRFEIGVLLHESLVIAKGDLALVYEPLRPTRTVVPIHRLVEILDALVDALHTILKIALLGSITIDPMLSFSMCHCHRLAAKLTAPLRIANMPFACKINF